jgi:tRNA modification GTPase
MTRAMRDMEAKRDLCDGVICVLDARAPIATHNKNLNKIFGAKPILYLLNKSDLDSCFDTERLAGHFRAVLPISVKNGDTSALFSHIDTLFTDDKIRIGEDAVLFSARQYAALKNAASYIATAVEALRAHHAVDAAAGDLELALGALAESDGRAVSDEIVSHIFAKFCVGK